MIRLGSGGRYEETVGYARVVANGEQAWTAGCTALSGSDVVGEGDPHAQTVAALRLAVAWLERAGFTVAEVVHSRMYVVDIAANADAVGRAHREVLGPVRPAATMVAVGALIDPRLLVEVELVAARDRTPATHPGLR